MILRACISPHLQNKCFALKIKFRRNASKFPIYLYIYYIFRFSIRGTFIHKVKMKVARNEKRKKLLGFSFYINIANFEAFLQYLNFSTNHLFWRCVEQSWFLTGILSRILQAFSNFGKLVWKHFYFTLQLSGDLDILHFCAQEKGVKICRSIKIGTIFLTSYKN